jgi:hypothetical protein
MNRLPRPSTCADRVANHFSAVPTVFHAPTTCADFIPQGIDKKEECSLFPHCSPPSRRSAPSPLCPTPHGLRSRHRPLEMTTMSLWPLPLHVVPRLEPLAPRQGEPRWPSASYTTLTVDGTFPAIPDPMVTSPSTPLAPRCCPTSASVLATYGPTPSPVPPQPNYHRRRDPRSGEPVLPACRSCSSHLLNPPRCR